MEPSDGKDRQTPGEQAENREQYEFVAETSIDGIVTSSANDRILTWNNGAQQMFGYGPELIDLPVTTIIPEKYREAHANGVKRFLATGEQHLLGRKAELMALRKNGTVFPIELTLSSWKNHDRVFFGAIIRDISERKRVEQMREDVYRIVRHDLKSPLIGIAGLAKVLLKGKNLAEDQIKAATLIQQQGMRLLAYIDRSRDIYLMEEGKYRLKPKPFNLVDLFVRIEGQLAVLIQKKRIALSFRLQDNPMKVGDKYLIEGEESLVEIMLTNLIKNAIEASPPDQRVAVEVAVEERAGRPHHRFSIRNPGVVPAELRDRFFDPYVTAGKEGGTGLGTHSARLVATAHHGHIGFTTSEAEGTHVFVHIPRDLEADPG